MSNGDVYRLQQTHVGRGSFLEGDVSTLSAPSGGEELSHIQMASLEGSHPDSHTHSGHTVIPGKHRYDMYA